MGVVQVWLRGRSRTPAGEPPVHTMAVLGSGGHTAEMLAKLNDPEILAGAKVGKELEHVEHEELERAPKRFRQALKANAEAEQEIEEVEGSQLPDSPEGGLKRTRSVIRVGLSDDEEGKQK